MDYIKEMNAFYDTDMANQLTPNAISLYFALLNIANKLYWKADFTVSNLTLQSRSGIADRKTLDRTRNQLIQKKLIIYKPSGKVNQAGSYTILGCVGQLGGKNATQSATQDGTQDGTQGVTQNDPINKQNKSNQNETKKEPPMSPLGEKAKSPKEEEEYSPEFETFWENYPRKNQKKRAYGCWKARIKEKNEPQDLITAAINYCNHCRSERTEERYIKHGSTFLSNKEDFKDWIDVRKEEKEYGYYFGSPDEPDKYAPYTGS